MTETFFSGKIAAGTTRCGEHSDYGSLTFLFQDDLGGLEVRDKSGEWVRARPVEDSMLVNILEILPMANFPYQVIFFTNKESGTTSDSGLF